jgi:hypothetical protein
MSPNLMAELTDMGGPRFGSGGFQRKKKSPAEAGLMVASLITLSSNQVTGFLADWEGLRRLAA